MPDCADYASMIPESPVEEQVIDLENKLEQTRLKLHDLVTMGAIITSILDLETILSVVMEMSIRTVDAEVGLIQVDENGKLVSKMTWGISDEVVKGIIYKDNQDISTYCFNKQEAIVLNQSESHLDFGPTVTSLLALPIKSRAKCHGTIVVINKTSESGFSEEDKNSLNMLVNFAAVAIDNSILIKESLQKQKIEQELTIAKQIQETILPEKETNVEGVEIGTMYRPARYVSGDFYDIIKISETDFLMVVGDVSSKGVPAAMLMSATTAIIRSELMRSSEITPSQLMTNLNNVLCTGITKGHDMFVTLFIGRFNLDRMQAIYCNAGHSPPFYWDSRKKGISELMPGGTFVGQFPDAEFKEGSIDFNHGDRFLAFTDGVTEAVDIHNGQFGVERLMQAFLDYSYLSPDEFCLKVREQVDRFAEGAGEEPFDDFTLLEIKILRKDK